MAKQNSQIEMKSVEEMLAIPEGIYTRHEYQSDFQLEKPILEKLIPDLIKHLKPLILVEPFAMGSTATIWEVKDTRLKQRRALKLARPKLGKIDNIIRVLRAETNKLAELTHQNN